LAHTAALTLQAMEVAFPDDAPTRYFNKPATGCFPEEGVVKMRFPWSPNVRCSSMGGSFAFLIGDIPPNTSPLSPNTPPTPPQLPPNTLPISPQYPYLCQRHGPGPKGPGLWALRDIGGALGGYWRCWRGIGGSLVCQWYVNGTLMVR